MGLRIYIKEIYCIVLSIFFLCSCGLIGGDDKIEVSENAVLSGPPLSIPPEFDIDSQNTNQQSTIPDYDTQVSIDNDNDLNNFENEITYETNQNENLFLDEMPPQSNITGNGEIQSFESFNPNLSRTNNQVNINRNSVEQKIYRSTVPSDSYNFGRILTNNKKKYAQKKPSNFAGFGRENRTFEQIEIKNTDNLSKEEEFLLEDILNQENKPGTYDQD